MDNHLSEEWAIEILGLYDACINEGGAFPDPVKVFEYIKKTYPYLANDERFIYLPWKDQSP